MSLISSIAPHIRSRSTNQIVMGDVIVALIPLYVMAVYFYGFRAVLLGGVSVLTCCVCQGAVSLLSGRGRPNFRDYTPIVTGLILPLLLPASISYFILATAAAFAILVVKMPFGGTGENIFNPAAGGFAFVAICWPSEIFRYPAPQTMLPLFGDVSQQLTVNASYTLRLGGRPAEGFLDMLLGNFAGPMGATNILVIITCLIYLIARRTVNWKLPLSFLGTAGLFALVFPRAGLSPTASLSYELMSGMLLFVAAFVITDPVTSPKRDSSKVMYGVAAGLIVMLFRRFGGFADSTVYAVLLMNTFVYLLDRLNERFHSAVRRKAIEADKI